MSRIFIAFVLIALTFPGTAKAWSPEGCDFNLALPAQAQTQKMMLDPKRVLAFTQRGLLAPRTIYGIKGNGLKVSCLIYGSRLTGQQLRQDFQKQLEVNTKEKGIKDWRVKGLSAIGSGMHQGVKFYIAIFYGPASQLALIVVKNKALFDQLHASVRLKR